MTTLEEVNVCAPTMDTVGASFIAEERGAGLAVPGVLFGGAARRGRRPARVPARAAQRRVGARSSSRPSRVLHGRCRGGTAPDTEVGTTVRRAPVHRSAVQAVPDTISARRWPTRG